MNIWEKYLEAAFHTVYYGGQHEKQLDRFIRKWGEPGYETLLRALSNGTQDEQTIALFALGQSNTSEAKAIVLPYLQSTDSRLQWASAISLGEMKEEAALSIIVRLLNEFLPPHAHPLEREGGLYHSWRMKIVNILGEWNRSETIPVLRHALIKSWEFEQHEQPARKHVWHSYQDELLYALGRSGAFGAITDFSLPASRLQLWMVFVSCGSLQSRTRYGDILTQMQMNLALQHEVTGVLEKRFGLSKEEQIECIDNFAETYFDRMRKKDPEAHPSVLTSSSN